eukprot:1352375-Amorphochlora_amoeboformis.AAC.1
MDIIKKLTVEQATKFYRKHYKPANAHLYIIGDLDVSRLRVRVKRSHDIVSSVGLNELFAWLEKAVESVENMLHNFTPPERTLDEE